MVDRIVTVPDSLELPAAVKVPTSRLSTATATGKAVLDATDTAAARKAIGAGPLGLVGTGMPNSVVSAPVGSYYTDTAGTNGAWRWLKKSGTGNTGWEVDHGDTGWRQLKADTTWAEALAPAGVTLVSNQPRVRRINNLVQLSICLDLSASGPFTATGPIPTGWRHSIPMAVLLSTSTHGLVRVWFSASSSPVTIQGSGPTVGAWGLVSYVTNDPWPTSLPGIPT